MSDGPVGRGENPKSSPVHKWPTRGLSGCDPKLIVIYPNWRPLHTHLQSIALHGICFVYADTGRCLLRTLSDHPAKMRKE